MALLPPPARRGGETDPRIIGELPAGETRTVGQNKKAREYFKNNLERAMSWWRARHPGETWPVLPDSGERVHAGHPRPLKDGGHPLFIEPEVGMSSNTPHTTRPEGGGPTDQERWGAMRSDDED
jgi:hypothetical protein